jgi:hypothetical protein
MKFYIPTEEQVELLIEGLILFSSAFVIASFGQFINNGISGIIFLIGFLYLLGKSVERMSRATIGYRFKDVKPLKNLNKEVY